jgi:hypothetical protein
VAQIVFPIADENVPAVWVAFAAAHPPGKDDDVSTPAKKLAYLREKMRQKLIRWCKKGDAILNPSTFDEGMIE